MLANRIVLRFPQAFWVLSGLFAGVCAVAAPIPDAGRAGGATTVNVTGVDAFSLPAANLTPVKRLDFSVGNSFFRNPWVIAPSSTDARDGLGALFNTNACQNCHINDGRGHPANEGAVNAVSMLVRLSLPVITPADAALAKVHGVVPVPAYGSQLQDMAVPGVAPEARVRLRWREEGITLKGGETVMLRRPQLQVTDLAYGPLPASTLMSARVAPPMIGLGLLEAIPEADLLALEDVDDRDNDGISGRTNQVWDVQRKATVVGRFGWKAGQPTLDQQNAAAFAGDMGLTSTLFPSDGCTSLQKDCCNATHGGQPEVSDGIRGNVLFYTRHLAVPASRDHGQPEVELGRKLFASVGCVSCHVPSHVTTSLTAPFAKKAGVEATLAAQTIWPYTDLLLHDMGGGLADGRAEFAANGSEWRTPPLWGIGLAQVVNPQAGFLHDGRARTLLEAILWHDGEAYAAKAVVAALSTSERNALLRFLESL